MFKVDDIVVIYSTRSTGLQSHNDINFGRVVAVGKYDLFCEHIEKLKYSSLFRVSKQRCFLVPAVDLNYTDGKIVLPKVGDLVMSMTSNVRKDRKAVTGIVEEIMFSPVKYESTTLKIRTGTAVESVKCESVIILESNS